MSEKCDRCLSVGEDRRTLFMACFYDMSEMEIPFKEFAMLEPQNQKTIVGKVIKEPHQIPNTPVRMGPMIVETPEPLSLRKFFTLRVCKRCRAEWMAAIENWFFSEPQGEDMDADDMNESNIGSGIFIREFGQTKEISEEEWYRRYPGVEPVRVKQ